jgi:cell division protein FtsZ
MADDVLHSGVRGVTDLMVMPGLINLDFADIRTVMAEMGKAMMGTGEAEGEGRAIDAAEAAISNPLLEDVSMKGAKGVLINITGGLDMTLFEVDEAANRIREEVDSEANIIFGSTFDEHLSGKMRISVVATGIDAEAVSQARPTISLVSNRDAVSATGSRAVTAEGYPQPLLAQNAAQSPIEGGRESARREPLRVEHDNEALPQVAEAAESAAMRDGSFVVPKPVDAGLSRSVSLTQPAVPPASVVKEPAPRPKGRVPSLIERVTGVGRARATPPEPARPAVQPAKQVAQPRLAPLEPGDRPSLSKEEDLLDIPAFLRRQAN